MGKYSELNLILNRLYELEPIILGTSSNQNTEVH